MHRDRLMLKFVLKSLLIALGVMAIPTVVLAQSSDTPTVTVPPAVVSAQEQIFGIIAVIAAVLVVTYFIRLRQCKNNSGPGRYD